jgi:hypothetical protein
MTRSGAAARGIARPRPPTQTTEKQETPVTKEELDMLDFAVKWAPFGGGDEHILPEFGVFPTVFYRRLRRLLTHHADINDSLRRRLEELCTLKLASTHPDKRRSCSHVRTVH